MYLLLSRIPNGLDPLRDRFESHVKRAGLESVQKSVGENPAEVEPKAYVAALLVVHRKNAELVAKAFRGDQGFVASLDKVSGALIADWLDFQRADSCRLQACREFVNRNAACASPNKSPELLAKYADSLLRKSNKANEEEDLEQSLVDTVSNC